MAREGTVTVTPEEWFGESPDRVDFRNKTLADARRRARKQLACIRIKVKDRFGSRTVATTDARYWLYDAERDVDRPPPSFQEIRARQERRSMTRKLNVPKFLF